MFLTYYKLTLKVIVSRYDIKYMITIINWLYYEIDNTLPFAIRTNEENSPSINLSHRLEFKRIIYFDNFTDEGDFFFFKNLS